MPEHPHDLVAGDLDQVAAAKVRINAAASSISGRRLVTFALQPGVNWPTSSWESVRTATL